MKKWIGLSLGTLLGISHIGMIGMIARKDSLPKLKLPIGELYMQHGFALPLASASRCIQGNKQILSIVTS